MTGPELKEALVRLNVPQQAFARYIHVNPRTVRRWIAGEQIVPGSVIRVLESLQLRAGRRRAS